MLGDHAREEQQMTGRGERTVTLARDPGPDDRILGVSIQCPGHKDQTPCTPGHEAQELCSRRRRRSLCVFMTVEPRDVAAAYLEMTRLDRFAVRKLIREGLQEERANGH